MHLRPRNDPIVHRGGKLGKAVALLLNDLDERHLAGELLQPQAADQRELRPQIAERQHFHHRAQAVDLGHMAVDSSFEHLLLAAEVLVETARARGQAGGRLDLAHGRAREPALRKEPHRLADDPLSRVRFGAHW